MKPYLISLGAGLLVGVVYGLLNVKSPAPPTIALIGLLGMLIGEQVIPVVKRIASGQPVLSYVKSDCVPAILGLEPAPKPAAPDAKV